MHGTGITKSPHLSVSTAPTVSKQHPCATHRHVLFSELREHIRGGVGKRDALRIKDDPGLFQDLGAMPFTRGLLVIGNS